MRCALHRLGVLAVLTAAVLAGPALVAQDDATDRAQALRQTLKKIVLTKIAFEDTPVSTVFAFLKQRSLELDPDGNGVNFVLLLRPEKPAAEAPAQEEPADAPAPGRRATTPHMARPAANDEAEPDEAEPDEVAPDELPVGPRVTLELNNATLDDVLRKICEVGRLRCEIDPAAVVIFRHDAKRDTVETRTVPAEPPLPQKIVGAQNTSDSTQALRQKLKKIVLTKLSFEDTPVSTIFGFLKSRSRELDPDGDGINFVLFLRPPRSAAEAPAQNRSAVAMQAPGNHEADLIEDAPEEGDAAAPPEPTVTLDLDNCTTLDAIRYACEMSGLRLKIEPAARRKLERTVIPKISFEDTPVSTVLAFLKQRSRDLDPDGTGAGFVVVPQPPEPAAEALAKNTPAVAKPAPGGGDAARDKIEPDALDDAQAQPAAPPPEPTATLDVDNFALGDIIRYTCEVSGLRFMIEPGAVVIIGPDVKRVNVELHALTDEPPQPQPAK